MVKRLILADLKSNNNHGICTGHYFALAQNYIDVFSDICDVKVAGGPIYQTKFAKEILIKLPCDYTVGKSKIVNTWNMIRNAWSLFHLAKKDDVIIIQQSQPAMILFSLLFTCFRKEGLYQIQYSDEPVRRPAFRFMLWLKKKYIKGILCPNEDVGKAYGVPYLVVPDYIYCNSKPTKYIPYSDKKYDFCSVGRIEPDKGVGDVAEAFELKNYSYLIAGVPQDKTEECRIQKSASVNKKIETNLSYIDSEQYNEYLTNSRYCILNYKGSYRERSSGVVFDTLFSGIPVIGSRCKALQFVEDYNLGVLFDRIEDTNFDSLFNEKKYLEFLSAIQKFKNSFVQHKLNMVKFLNLD